VAIAAVAAVTAVATAVATAAAKLYGIAVRRCVSRGKPVGAKSTRCQSHARPRPNPQQSLTQPRASLR
jgi:hypothetical protein